MDDTGNKQGEKEIGPFCVAEEVLQQLISAGIQGVDLYHLNNKVLIERYQQCLELLGIQRTSLSHFRIDKLGWSPEIAEEKKNPLYLSAGIENPFAIIVTPEQKHLAAHFPHNTYDVFLVEAYFQKFSAEIADLTTVAGLALEINEGLTTYNEPEDLLLVNTVTLHTYITGDVSDIINQQRQLVQTFLNDKWAWADPKLRADLVQSAKMQGDLRNRRTLIPDFNFEHLGSYYSRAFGGAFILRQLERGLQLMVLEEQMHLKLSMETVKHTTFLQDPELLPRLYHEGFIACDLASYHANPNLWQRKIGLLWAEGISAAYPEIDYLALTPPQKRGLVMELDNVPIKMGLEMERLAKKIESGVLTVKDISLELKVFLSTPARCLPAYEQEVIMKLLTRFQPFDPISLFNTDRELFVKEFMKWPPAKKAWVIAELTSSFKNNQRSIGRLKR